MADPICTPSDRNDRPPTPRNLGNGDSPHLSPVTPAEDARTILLNEVSWGAVMAGVVVALVTQLILNMLGLGIGIATVDPAAGSSGTPSASTLSIGAGLWWTVSGILAALFGGYAAGRLSGKPKESAAGWHGLTSWAFSTLIIFYLLTSTVSGIVGGAFSAATTALGQTAQTAIQTAAPQLGQATDPFGAIQNQIQSATGGSDPAALREAATSALRAAFTGDQQQADQARQRAAEALARAQNISPEQARAQVEQYQQQYTQAMERARQQAAQAAQATSDALSRGALFGALALILGGIAAWFGGRMGTTYPTLTDFRRTRRPV